MMFLVRLLRALQVWFGFFSTASPGQLRQSKEHA